MENTAPLLGHDKVREGQELITKYKSARSAVEARILSDESFWNTRHTDSITDSRSSDMPFTASTWMFSSIVNKHADMMESLPTPLCLAREKSDEESASALNSILPVIFDRADFTSVYSDAQYDKLKHGTAVYGVFWNPLLENGLGDIEIKKINLLNIYPEPGVTNIEDSKNVFYASKVDRNDLLDSYPYISESDLDKSFFAQTDTDKVIVIDWYYKKRVGTKTHLHYIKFSGDALLYASENDPDCIGGFYEHGKYPFVFDTLFRETSSCFGYGLISVTKGAQKYIDRLDQNILERSIMSSKPRYLMKKNVGLNKDEFLNWNNPIVEVEGDLTEERFHAITLPELDSSVLTVRDSKIKEMREVTSNRDVNHGTSESLTSGVAIAALQEAGSKVTRDIITNSFNAYESVVRLVIELIRQFYSDERCFRITEPNGDGYRYLNYSAKGLREEKITIGNDIFYRLPIFDIEVKAKTTSVFSRLAQNETIINLYKLGFFKSENNAESISALSSMELEGKKQILESLRNNKNSLSDTPDTQSSSDEKIKSKVSEGVKSAKKLYEVKND